MKAARAPDALGWFGADRLYRTDPTDNYDKCSAAIINAPFSGVVTFSIEIDQGDVPEAFYEAEDGPTQ